MLMLFDYDGVIADSVDYLLDLCVQAQASLGSGRPPVRDDLRTIESLTFHDLGQWIASLQARYACSSRDTLMTGDAISDIREGKRAGVRTAAVAWGYQDLALLARENPDHLVYQPRDLLKLVADRTPA